MITGLKRKLDYDDYAGIPPDRNRYEILEGELYVTPVPSPPHQRVSKRLQRQLEAYFEARGLGEAFDAPIDLVEALGGEGETIEDPRRLRPALERALGSGRVACLNVILDPDAYRREGGGSLAI